LENFGTYYDLGSEWEKEYWKLEKLFNPILPSNSKKLRKKKREI